MTVKIVTDSAADIPDDDMKRMGITVVPTYINFDGKTFKDGVDIDRDTFYNDLLISPVHLTTSAPSPGDFTLAYNSASHDHKDIVSIHVSRKHSAIFDAAMAGKSSIDTGNSHIEVIDSEGVTMWQGFVVLAAAKAAAAGANIDSVIHTAHQTINQLRGIGLLDTMAQIAKGGRLSKAVSALESVIHVKLMLTLRDGELRPFGLARTRQKGIDKIAQFIDSLSKIKNAAICYSTTKEEALTLADRVKSHISMASIRVIRICPTLAVHAGPGVLIAALESWNAQ